MKVLGLIPARGGSKGVPRKNIKRIKNKPLIFYTIDQALESKFLSNLVTSTDCDEIFAIAEELGGNPIKRPEHLAMDDTKMYPVAVHALQIAEEQFGKFDALVLLQPTCPLRTGEMIDDAIKMLSYPDVNCVVSVTDVGDNHPARMYRLDDEDILSSLMPELENENRQDLPRIYHRNGLIYAIKTDTFQNEKTFTPSNIKALVTPYEKSVNIDEPFDFELAKYLIENGYA